jgi:hypothetical protein
MRQGRVSRVARALAGAGLIGLLLVTTACRQADGALPMPVDDQPNKVGDVARDLQNVAAGVEGSPGELREDLGGFDAVPRPTALVDGLSAALVGALDGTEPTVGQAEELARLAFLTTTALELSETQIAQLAVDLNAAAVAAGADAENADRLAAAATELQSAITLNPRRWYHLF